MTNLPNPMTQVEFYENVAFKRLIAWGFDAVFVMILCIIILPFTGFTALFFLPLFWLVVGFAYRTITIANRSATWGMRIMSIELRTLEGLRLDLSAAVLHTLGYTLSIGTFLVQAVSIVLICSSTRGQSLTDHILGTVMINRSAHR